jgi:molecular chaperone GrpE
MTPDERDILQDSADPAPTVDSPAIADGTGGTKPSAEQGAEPGTLQEHLTHLERELAAERERATDYMQKWQRAQADYANFRRRAQADQEQLATIASAQTLALVLPALDSLERAFKVLPESLHHLTWIDGIALVELQLRRALETQGLTPFEPRPGDPLDFTRHQAVAETPTAEHPEGVIVEVVQRGYELNGRALRPALVRVARKPESAPSGSPPSGTGPPEAAPPDDAADSGSSP